MPFLAKTNFRVFELNKNSRTDFQAHLIKLSFSEIVSDVFNNLILQFLTKIKGINLKCLKRNGCLIKMYKFDKSEEKKCLNATKDEFLS